VKITNLRGLEKYLQEASSRAHVYLIACPHEADRREIADKIVSAVQPEKPVSPQRFTGSLGFAAAFEELRTENLFALERVIILEDVDKLKENESANLKRWLQNPSRRIFLLLGLESARGLAPYLPLVQPEVVLLDLTQEKPWERQQRLGEALRSMAGSCKIHMEEAVFDFLLHQVGQDWTQLKREMEKLLCLGGQKKQIVLEDARSIVASGVFPEGWVLAEQLIYQAQPLATAPFLDASALLSLLGQLRYYLRMGWQITLGEENSYLPLKSYQLQKFGDKARSKGPRFFEKGLMALNEVEALAKSSSISSDLLLHRFVVHLHTI